MYKNKTTATVIALILMFAMVTSLIVIPAVNAQTTWSIYISATPSTGLVRGEVRLNNIRQSKPFTNIMLAVKAPGDTAWTYLGPFSTTNGRVDYTYAFTKAGTYQFQYIVPPQSPLPTNPATADGKWYSDIAEAVIPTKKTYPYIGAIPNPVGVGQEVLLHFGITDAHMGGVGYGWVDLTVTVTRPDGVVDTLGPFMTDSTGGTGTVLVPAMVGDYTLQTNFPEQIYAGVVRLASTSTKLTLVVQEEPIQYYPGVPLPTEYWTRPIDPQLREWHTVAGNWLEAYPDNLIVEGNDDAPETAHILWTKLMTTGGLVGEPRDQHSFEMGDAYEGKFITRFIVAGKLYYDKYATADPYHEIVCVDLHTGEEIWSRTLLNNRTISFCQLMYWDTYDYHGVYDYLWTSGNVDSLSQLGFNITALGLNSTTVGTIWLAFDPFTGDFQWSLYGVPSGTRVMGPKGEILIYTFNMTGGYMTLWNSSNIPALYADTTYNSMGWGQWRAMGKIRNATAAISRPTTPLGLSGYQWNVSIAGNLGNRSVPGSVTAIFEGDRVIGGTISQTEVKLWGLSLKPEQEGYLLFNTTWRAPDEWVKGNVTVSGFGAGWTDWSKEDYVGVLWVKETREHFGFSLNTGKCLWGPTEPQYYLDSVEDSVAEVRNIAYGKLYSASVSGIVYCYDVQTGKRLWTYEATDPYQEYLFANTWWLKPVCITDGKIYLGHAEHSPIDPRPRGAPFICLNATTGELIWRINGAFRQTRWGGRGLIGDSIIVTRDTYDNVIYAIGKGPSATTVTAPDMGVPLSKSVLIRGTVTDVSPGTKDAGLTMRFPNGVPAVADESMSDWMMYVYKQFPRPADATGVEVVLTVLDPNGNSYEVGRATSDASGFYSCAFTPEVPGKYTIIASFDGSGAYYGSSAETAVFVEEAPVATPEPTPTPMPMSEMYFVPAVIGIIVTIAVVGIGLALLMLRKRQ